MKTARIAAALAKTQAARGFDVDEIARDAHALGRTTRAARDALMRQLPTSELAKEARVIAERYGAELVDRRDPDTMVFGLRFRDGSYSGPMRNTFRIL